MRSSIGLESLREMMRQILQLPHLTALEAVPDCGTGRGKPSEVQGSCQARETEMRAGEVRVE